MFRPRVIALLLVLITLLAYLPALQNGFVNFDDETYVVDNLKVHDGLTWPGVKWAFTTFYFSNWHPLTWVAYMADYQLFRLNPAGHHLINLLFHAANAGLLFLLLWRLTGALWSGAFVAALFAWHPVHVESVAWIAELKDVMSTFWGLLALLAYVHYAQSVKRDPGLAANEPPAAGPSPVARHPLRIYWLTLGCFAVSLMFKSMLVTLPFVMLLLDGWPLHRLQKLSNLWRCLWEKLPFFLLSAVISELTVLAQRQAMASFAAVSFDLRLGNVVTAYAGYLGKAFWPVHLAVLYPLPGEVPWPELALALLALGAISIAVVFAARRQPWLPVGWLWYLGTLVPVIGLVQVGSQSMADRYTYFPLIGIFLAVTLMVREFARRFQISPAVMAIPAGLILAACLLVTENQLSYWRDSQTLFTHVLNTTSNNPLGHLVMGGALQEQNLPDQALVEFQKALKLNNGQPEIYNSIGRAWMSKGQPEVALKYLRKAVQLKPQSVDFRECLGIVLIELGRLDEAKREFLEAVQQDASYAPAQFRLGWILLRQGQGVEAVKCLQAALRLEPKNLEMLVYTARVLAAADDPRICDGTGACALAERASQLVPNGTTVVCDTLAMAYAAAGRFNEAVAAEQQAIKLAEADGDSADEPAMQQRLELYQKHQPWRQSFLGKGG